MSAGDPAPLRRLAHPLAAVLLVIAGSAGGRATASDLPSLPLTLERPADGSAATVAAGPALLHVAFFATWCSPCLEELRAMADLESRWASSGYRLVLVAVQSRQSRERVAAFVSESRPPGEVLFDSTGEGARALGVDHVPTHLLLDRQGKIVFRSDSFAEGVRLAVEERLTRRTGAQGLRR